VLCLPSSLLDASRSPEASLTSTALSITMFMYSSNPYEDSSAIFRSPLQTEPWYLNLAFNPCFKLVIEPYGDNGFCLEKLEDVVDGRQKDILSLAVATSSSRHGLGER